MAAVLERFTQRREERRTFGNPSTRFGAPGGPDPREAGSKGGRMTKARRALREELEAEQAALDRSKNGMAFVKIAERRARRNRELEEAIIRARADAERQARIADYHVSDLLDEAKELEEEVNARVAEVKRLEAREALLKDAVTAEEDALVHRLRELHEAGGLEPVLVALDLFDVEEDGDGAAQAA